MVHAIMLNDLTDAMFDWWNSGWMGETALHLNRKVRGSISVLKYIEGSGNDVFPVDVSESMPRIAGDP